MIHPLPLASDQDPKDVPAVISYTLIETGGGKTSARKEPTGDEEPSIVFNRRTVSSSYQSLPGFLACCDSCNGWRNVPSHRT